MIFVGASGQNLPRLVSKSGPQHCATGRRAYPHQAFQ